MDDSPAAVDVGACSAARVSLGAVENRRTEDRTSGLISAAGSPQPVSPCPPGADTPLARDYPALAALPRDELEYLLAAPLDDNIQADQDVYLDALIHSLPEMHALYDEHRRLRGLVENAAGTARRIIAHSHSSQRAAASRARDAPRRDDRRLRGGYLCPGAVAARRAGHAGGLQGKSETAQLFTQRFSPYALQSRLQLAMHRAHDESEELADAYVEGLPLSHTVPLDVCYGSAVH
mgnify:CR=1 FL=1